MGCSTAGEIFGTEVLDDSLTATAIKFEHSRIKGISARLGDFEDAFQAGEFLAKTLPHSFPVSDSKTRENLVHVLVFSDGLKVNGSDLVRGLSKHLPAGITVTGGMAGDGARFQETLVFLDDVPQNDAIIALGLYGDRLKIGFGSLGGWDSFGPERLITRSNGNVLYEQRFGFTYIVCATGKSAEEMFAILQRRLQQDRATELKEAAEQQRQITQIRLGKWLTS